MNILNKQPWLKPVFVAIASCTLLASCSGGEEKKDEIVRPAKLHVVASASETFDNSFPAIIEAGKSSTLTFQVSGLLTRFPVREGQQLRRGAVIARLDDRRYRNAVNSARAQYASANSEYQSARRLLEEDAIARIAVDQRRAQRDVAQAQLDSARKDLSDTILRAPFSGIVAEKLVEQFENVSPNQDIVTLQSVGTVEAVVSVPASLVPRLANRPPSESYVILGAAPDRKIPGVFRSVTTQGDTESQTFQVKFAFTPPASLSVLPGMTGTVFTSRALLEGEKAENQVMVPLGAILSDGKKRFVWVVDTKKMTVKKRAVEVSTGVGESVPVVSGLKQDETIVAAGAAYLNDGDKIRPYKP
ncbi:MAG: efflux RND transporter periplasmic adaptor subunit [Parasphingorhabdus sp.]|uniref:efflux RND transporter periplasmic adaptor subunit n=1 Tax=Parasphingorhabdus sp. TaxID=2709688 RepID=UPI00300366C5